MATLTKEMKDDIILRSKNGESHTCLGKIYGCDPSYVSYIKSRHNVLRKSAETSIDKVRRILFLNTKYHGTRKLKKVKK